MTSDRKKRVQNASSSEDPQSTPSTRRSPKGSDAHRHHTGDGGDPVELSDLVKGGIEDHIGARLVDRSRSERLDLLVPHLAEPTDLRLGDAVDPQRFDEVVDLAGGNAFDVGLDHDRVQGPLGPATGLEQTREVGAAGDLGDLEFDGPDAGVPGAGAIAVSLRAALGAALVGQGADLGADLGLHNRLGEDSYAFS